MTPKSYIVELSGGGLWAPWKVSQWAPWSPTLFCKVCKDASPEQQTLVLWGPLLLPKHNLKLCRPTSFYFAHKATLYFQHNLVAGPLTLTFLLLLQLPQVQHCGHFERHRFAQVGNRRCGSAPGGSEQVRTRAEGGGQHLGEQLLGLDRVQVMENLQE
jgi:hypothetical protein